MQNHFQELEATVSRHYEEYRLRVHLPILAELSTMERASARVLMEDLKQASSKMTTLQIFNEKLKRIESLRIALARTLHEFEVVALDKI